MAESVSLPSLIAMYSRFGPHPPSLLVIAPRSLTTLSIHPRTDVELQYPDQLQAFMSKLASSFPFLRTLDVLDDPRMNTAGALLKDFRELRCLRHLNLRNGCGPLTPLDWQLVADSFCLETMDVSVAEFNNFVNYRIELPHLRDLRCAGYGDQLALFLTSARLLNLQSLTLLWFGTIPLAEFCSLFSIISSCLHHSSLRRLVLARRGTIEVIPYRMLARVQTSAEYAGQLCFSDILRPCFAFRNLEDLAIRVHWKDEPIDFTDDDFLSIARAFPYLRNFEVVLRPTSGLTAKSLVHVAQSCPRLVWLEALIDHLQPIASPERIHRIANHPLRTIVSTMFYEWPANHHFDDNKRPSAEASLRSIFPNLRHTETLFSYKKWLAYTSWQGKSSLNRLAVMHTLT